MMDAIFQQFEKHSPISTMARATFEYGMAADHIDEIFRRNAWYQEERDLLFSSVVELLGLAVMRSRNSVNEAYRQQKEELGVTVKSVYDKMANTEPPVARALVRDTAARMAKLVGTLGAERPPRIAGLRMKILDGKHLNGTEHRLKETRRLNSAPLPGQWLVVLDPQRRLIEDAVPCEDGHAQERRLLGEVLPMVGPGELWTGDRNFCTTGFLFGIARRDGMFLVRQHGTTLCGKRLLGKRLKSGRCEKGTVYEQAMEIVDPDTGETMVVRRITIELDRPTRDGDKEIHLVSNVPAEMADGIALAEAYRDRWSVESALQELGQSLHAEINTLTYPRAALLAFAVAMMTYNVISVMKAALRSVHGEAAAPENLSGYYLASELKAVYGGMMVAIPGNHWQQRFGTASTRAMSQFLKRCAKHVRLDVYLKNKRGPKKRPPPRTGGLREKHVSTYRLLAGRLP